MEGNNDGVLSNGSFALKKDKSLILTLDQDQGDGEKKAETDADGIIDVLRDKIQGLQAEKREVEHQLDYTRKELHRAEAESHSLAAQAHHLEGKLVRTQEDLAAAVCTAEDFKAEANCLKRAIKDLEADKASLIASRSSTPLSLPLPPSFPLIRRAIPQSLRKPPSLLSCRSFFRFSTSLDHLSSLRACPRRLQRRRGLHPPQGPPRRR